MSIEQTSNVTALLGRLSDADATAELLQRVHEELRSIAARHLCRERPDHTLQPTALVNEVYLRLFGNQPITFNDRQHFFAIAAESMRRILLEHARNRKRLKRGGGRQRLPMTVIELAAEENGANMLAVDEAISRLQAVDAHLARVVHLRFFAGLTEPEAADVLGISDRTVRRDWQFARAFLARELAYDTQK